MTSCQTSAFLPHRLGFPQLWRFCFAKSLPHSCLLECSLETTTSSQWMETAWSGVDSDVPHVYEYWFIIYLYFAYAFSNQALLPANIKSPVVITWLIVDCQCLLLMILSPQQLLSTFSLLKYHRIEKKQQDRGKLRRMGRVCRLFPHHLLSIRRHTLGKKKSLVYLEGESTRTKTCISRCENVSSFYHLGK